MGKPSDKSDIDIDAFMEEELAKFEAEERARLGLDEGPKEQWQDTMTSAEFFASQRAKTTILVGGLTMAHDYLVEGALNGIGYDVRALDCADNTSLRYGKEFGNRGQCNPTYFTVGNLVKELCRIRDEEGLTEREVVERYAFLTAGACGPCRFGMYVTEYRKALRDAGFDGFRVLLFQQTGGIKQASGEEVGLVLNPTFFWSIAKALFVGDVINVMQYRLRPFEVVPGSVNEAIQAVKDEVYAELSKRDEKGDYAGNVLEALWRGRKILQKVELDRLKPKPKVAIIGEFWAMTTEGDGNYHLQRFLEEEGAEVNIQVLANTLLYNLWEFRHDTLARAELHGADESKFGLEGSDFGLTMAGLYLGEAALRGLWNSFALILGLNHHVHPNMDEVATAGHSHYNVELRGGEGHLEVAKLILNVAKHKCHMTLSVKPFGCMPSSGVSDGVQSVITELYPDAIFCPVETNGDGAVNFYSRVQMYLFKARQRAQEEFAAALEEHGVTEEQVREYLREHPRMNHPFALPPHRAAGTGADLVHEVAPYIGKSRLGRARVRAGRMVEGARTFATKTFPQKASSVRKVVPYLPAIARFAAAEVGEKYPRTREMFEKLLAQAVELTDTQQQSVAAAETAPTPRVEKSGGLPVMA